MAVDISAPIRDIVRRLDALLTEEAEFTDQLQAIDIAIAEIDGAWSGSQLGYQARVYYDDFRAPPPGDHFSREWGLMESVAPGTTGDWVEKSSDDVLVAVAAKAGWVDLKGARQWANRCSVALDEESGRLESVLSIVSEFRPNTHLVHLMERARDLKILSEEAAANAHLPKGKIVTRDSVAHSQGFQVAPHQRIQATVNHIRSAGATIRKLDAVCRLAMDHLELSAVLEPPATVGERGGAVFIGHGRSLLWMKLKDFIQDRIGLSWEEFNRVPVAGLSNTSRLEAMLENSAIAFVIMTAEDEQIDGQFRARENVVHEVGLFQGRLGFTRAIILAEEGCGEFSNIHGLGQIRFPVGRIEAAFEQVRLVLERESLIPQQIKSE